MPPVSARQEFKPAQQRALALLRDGRETELTRGGYQEIGRVSRSQAAYDLAELVEAGILERVGSGRLTRYVLARHPNLTRRHWTSDRIRAELASFCAGRGAWPSAKEFKSAGHADLYVAASRYGGVAFWAAELGLLRGARRWEKPSIARLKLSLSWAIIGAAGGAIAVGAAVAIVQGLPGGAAAPETRHAASAPPAATSAAKSSGAHVQKRARKSAARVRTAKARVGHTAVRQIRSTPEAAQSSTTAVLAARTVSPPSPPAPTTTSTSSPVRTTETSASAGAGPTPLMAPRSGSASPAPLPAPK